jgi:hypothetical protein
MSNWTVGILATAALIGMASRWDGKPRIDTVKHTTLEFRP